MNRTFACAVLCVLAVSPAFAHDDDDDVILLITSSSAVVNPFLLAACFSPPPLIASALPTESARLATRALRGRAARAPPFA